MTIETAIKKAIEGGWRSDDPMVVDGSERYVNMVGYEKILLDPTFWQCLGKAMGWTKQTQEVQLDGFNLEAMNNGCSSTTKDIEYNWLYYWHRFIDHLADGGDANSFFKNL